MTSDPKIPGNDTDIDSELESIRSQWQAMDQAEPPELLDQAVINAARRELEASRPGRRPLRWLGGFATAAVVILALSIVVQQPPPPVVLAPEQAPEIRVEERALTDSVGRNSGAARAVPRERRDDMNGLEKQADSPDAAALEAAPAPASSPATMKAMRSEDLAESEIAGTPEAFSTISEPPVRNAEAWIERLLELSTAGKDEELEREIEAFRAHYPDHPLPAVLTER